MTEERVIEQLRRKLSLLVEYEHFKSLEEIAKAIGTATKTLEGWADYGSDKVTKGLIPKKHFQAVIDIFAKPIQKNHAGADVEALVKSDVTELARYLNNLPRYSFHDLVEQDAIKQNARVFIDQNQGLPAVKRRSKPKPITQYSVTVEQWFWIEFKTDLNAPHTVAIQQRDSDWAFCDVEYVAGERQLLVPGTRADGFPDSIQETDWEGINTFFVLQSQKSWPQDFYQTIISGLPVDNSLLQKLADHYASNLSEYRRLFAVDIDVCKT